MQSSCFLSISLVISPFLAINFSFFAVGYKEKHNKQGKTGALSPEYRSPDHQYKIGKKGKPLP